MVVAIDGTAGSGKSTVAKEVAKRLGFYFLNTGSFYRAYTLSAIENGIDMSDSNSILENSKKHSITVQNGDICLDGIDVENKLHSPEIDKYSSIISGDPRLREIVTERVREIAGTMNIVTEGRDTTTVIFPDADVRFYFDADLDVRANRRKKEQEEGTTIEDVRMALVSRDHMDKTKPVGALRLAPGAIYLDTSLLTINEVCDIVLYAVENHLR